MINKRQMQISFILAMLCLTIKFFWNMLDSTSMANKFIATINMLGASGYWYVPLLVAGWYIIVFTGCFYLFFRLLNTVVRFLRRR